MSARDENAFDDVSASESDLASVEPIEDNYPTREDMSEEELEIFAAEQTAWIEESMQRYIDKPRIRWIIRDGLPKSA